MLLIWSGLKLRNLVRCYRRVCNIAVACDSSCCSQRQGVPDAGISMVRTARPWIVDMRASADKASGCAPLRARNQKSTDLYESGTSIPASQRQNFKQSKLSWLGQVWKIQRGWYWAYSITDSPEQLQLIPIGMLRTSILVRGRVA